MEHDMNRLKIKDYFITIGLEIHVALKTKKKLFSQSENHFSINTFAPLDIALPGALPVLNKEAVHHAILFGLGVKAKINSASQFERKHYFYPDLSLGYQITQQTNPIVIGGVVPIEVDGKIKNIQIHHAHLECDAAKSIHTLYDNYSAIDISRGGTALIEIVSMPCMHSPQEAKSYAKQIYHLVTFLDICDGKLEEGSFRVDASISVNKSPNQLGTRVEIKNISSFQFIEEALEYEIHRQIESLESGKSIILETRQFKEDKKETVSMREKETELDYRYLIDPDIPTLLIDDEEIQQLKIHFNDYFSVKSYWLDQINQHQIDITSSQIDSVILKFRKILPKFMYKIDSKHMERFLRMIFFWLSDVELSKEINQQDIEELVLSKLGAKEVKEVFNKWQNSSQPIIHFIPKFLTLDEIEPIILSVLAQFPEQRQKAISGENKMKQFLIGKCMAQLKGMAQASDIVNMVDQSLLS